MSSWSADMWFDMAEAEMASRGITGFPVHLAKPKEGCPLCGKRRKSRPNKTYQHCAECIRSGESMAARRFAT